MEKIIFKVEYAKINKNFYIIKFNFDKFINEIDHMFVGAI